VFHTARFGVPAQFRKVQHMIHRLDKRRATCLHRLQKGRLGVIQLRVSEQLCRCQDTMERSAQLMRYAEKSSRQDNAEAENSVTDLDMNKLFALSASVIRRLSTADSIITPEEKKGECV
jgi:hypothetical protein